MEYKMNGKITPRQISELRKAVGWNGMQNSYKLSLKNSYIYFCCFDNDKLIGFLDVVSNGVTDAYIQDVIVHPEYQGKGIGTELMNQAITKLTSDKIYAVSVLFEERLLNFYKKFGFNIIMAGQMETFKSE